MRRGVYQTAYGREPRRETTGLCPVRTRTFGFVGHGVEDERRDAVDVELERVERGPLAVDGVRMKITCPSRTTKSKTS